ncbi:hypothetical protein [Natrinema hispanicum]|uniref:Uncharacterized protein n=1 Tax=Natrinema hispanicum TaxID=392421 RepID=A0A1I0JU03_9EURY|nr:hypothetical protein [Natrinema hispanicum]SEU14054.1 hypothetical protein SAMN04488694_1634 [Natrinema hispanicum]
MGTMASRGAKAFLTIWLLAISFVFLYYYPNGTGVYRYPGMFVTSMDMFANGYASTDVITRIPILSTTTLDQSSYGSDFARVAIQNASQYPSLVSAYLIVMELTGMGARDFMALGIGIFFVPVVVYITTRRLLSTTVAAAYASYFTVYMLTLPVSYRSYASFITVPALFLLIYIIHRSLDTSRKRVQGLLFLLIFLHPLTWHTATIQVGTLIVGILGLAVVATYVSRHSDRIVARYPVENLLRTIVFAGIITATFIAIWDSLYVAAILMGGLPLGDFISNIAGLLGSGGGSDPIPYEWDYRKMYAGTVYFYTHMLIHVISALLMTVATGYLGLSVLRGKRLSERQTRALIYLLGAGGAQIIFSVLYSRTALGLAFVTDVFILIGVYGILTINVDQRIRKGATVSALAICLVLSATMVGAIATTDNLGRDPVTTHESTDSSSQWIDGYTNGLVMTDFNLQSSFMSNTIQSGNELYEVLVVDPHHYEMAVGDRPLQPEYTSAYYVVDQASRDDKRPIHAYSDRVLMEPYPDRIDENGELNRIYGDESVTIYQFDDEAASES